jgi:hypothetical protein
MSEATADQHAVAIAIIDAVLAIRQMTSDPHLRASIVHRVTEEMRRVVNDPTWGADTVRK